LDPVIRRAEEVETTIEILSRRTKRSSTWVEKEILVGCDR
jgi:ATP-dependent Clp protease ATP-binding subunit ClpA